MRKYLLINQKNISYTDEGEGKVIVLIHGYLESLNVWEKFSSELAKSFRVICYDIPGHGESEPLSEKHSMEQLASNFNEFLTILKVEKCFMVGHSMGGYVTLMFHKLFPDKLSGFSLFHSHPYADNEATIKKRLREIDFVKNGKKDLIAKFNIPNAFAKQSLDIYQNEVEEAIKIAINTPENGIIANLYAMMNRPDLSESLKNSGLPFLLIAGKYDSYIDFGLVATNIQLPIKSEFLVLGNSGHMGFLEENELSLAKITNFLDKL